MPAKSIPRDLVIHATSRVDKIMQQTVNLADNDDEAAAIAFAVSSIMLLKTASLFDAVVPGFEALEPIDRLSAMVAVVGAFLAKGDRPNSIACSVELQAVMSNMRKLLRREWPNGVPYESEPL